MMMTHAWCVQARGCRTRRCSTSAPRATSPSTGASGTPTAGNTCQNPGILTAFCLPTSAQSQPSSLCAPSIICETKSVIWMSERGKFSGLIKLTLSWFYINLPGVWTDPSLGRGCWCWPIFSILCGRDVETWGRSRFKQYYVVQHSRHSQDQGTISTAWNTECLPLQTLSGVGEDPVRGQLQPGAVHGRRQGVLPEDPQAAQPRHCLLSLQVRFFANMLFGLSPTEMFCCPPYRSIC